MSCSETVFTIHLFSWFLAIGSVLLLDPGRIWSENNLWLSFMKWKLIGHSDVSLEEKPNEAIPVALPSDCWSLSRGYDCQIAFSEDYWESLTRHIGI